MGYLKPQETDLLYMPSDPTHTYWVRMRKKPNWGVTRDASNHMMKISAVGTAANGAQQITQKDVKISSDAEYGEYVKALVFGLITEWNLTDDQEHLLPLTPENLDLIDDKDGGFLAAEAQKRGGLRRAEEEQNFGNRSQRRSKATK